MPKALIFILIAIGLFFIIIGIFSKTFLIVGFILIIVGLYYGLGPDGVLGKDQVIDTWSALIEKGQGNAAAVSKDAEAFIADSKAPGIKFENKEIAPSIITGMIGNKRDFLVIRDTSNHKLEPYQLYLNARDYGDNLDVSWYLTFKPSVLQSLIALIPFVSVAQFTINDLNVFDQQDLRAYGTNAHHGIMKAVDKLVLNLGQDPNKLQRMSRGFLGIS
jgi:hypothetical protein